MDSTCKKCIFVKINTNECSHRRYNTKNRECPLLSIPNEDLWKKFVN